MDADPEIVVEYGFDGGTPARVERLGPRRFRLEPHACRPGPQWFHLCVQVRADAAGPVTLEIDWPPGLCREDLPPGLSEEEIHRRTDYDSFARVLPACCVCRHENGAWEPVGGVSVDGDRVTASLEVRKGVTEFATQMPYRWADLEALLAQVRQVRPDALRVIGASQAGLPIHAVTLGRRADAPTVHLQAYQHATEFTGPHVADALIRHALAHPDAPGELKLQVVPVVDVDALFYGMPLVLQDAVTTSVRRVNINRCWDDRSWPEVAAVEDLILERRREGARFVAGLDFHNGWWKAQASGACYTVLDPEEAGPELDARQRRLVEHLLASTDHERPGTTWCHKVEGTFSRWFHRATGGLGHTVEFSRHLWWNRARQAYEPARPHHPAAYARDLLAALRAYDWS